MKRILLDKINSTNSYIEKNAKNLPQNTLVIAKDQTHGHGQFQRTWFSEPNKSLTLSFLFWSNKNSINAIAQTPYKIADLLNQFYEINSEVVLPNDIYLNGKKLCGILIETSYELQELRYAIVGIGINLNNDKFPPEIADKATSIKIETNKTVNIDKFIDQLEKAMETLYA